MALANPPDPQQPVVRPSDGRVDEDWYRWFLAFVLFCQQLQALAEGIEDDVAALELVEEWVLDMPKVVNGTRTIILKSLVERTVNSIVTDCLSGTCTITGYIDGAALGGNASSVSSTGAEEEHASANVIPAGGTLTLVITANSACLDLVAQVNTTRSIA